MIVSTILNVSEFKKINITVVIICFPWFLLIIPNFYDRFYACNGAMTKVKAFRVYGPVFMFVKGDSLNYQPEIGLLFSAPTDVINLCGKIRIRKSRHYGGQAM